MTTIMPEGEELRKAVKWISEERQENPDKKMSELIAAACLKFDLSPNDGECLCRTLKN